jgi:hypothetical protein
LARGSWLFSFAVSAFNLVNKQPEDDAERSAIVKIVEPRLLDGVWNETAAKCMRVSLKQIPAEMPPKCSCIGLSRDVFDQIIYPNRGFE